MVMVMAGSSFVTVFLGALQASVSVLLTILIGVFATQVGLIEERSARNVASLCVRLFLPALLLTNIGSEFNLDSGYRYVPIIVWGLAYNSVFILLGLAMQRLFKMPSWMTPALVFNNTTAFPLLLVQSLSTTSLFEYLLWGKDDTTDNVTSRAVSYFLINSMVSNSLTFGLGPMLLDKEKNPEVASAKRRQSRLASMEVHRIRASPTASQTDLERAQAYERQEEEEEVAANEETSLLPHRVNVAHVHVRHESYKAGLTLWEKLPGKLQWLLGGVFSFISAPLIGALIGVIIGIVPTLQRLFFAEPEDGGYFKAWLTVTLQNIGGLFAALQVIVVGIKLAKSLRALKNREESGNLHWGALITIVIGRFFFFPAVSISVMYLIASRTSIVPDDPVLWFAMMIMHTGPPALELVAMADVHGADEMEKLSISKLITICYCVSPVIAFTVVGALKALKAVENI